MYVCAFVCYAVCLSTDRFNCCVLLSAVRQNELRQLELYFLDYSRLRVSVGKPVSVVVYSKTKPAEPNVTRYMSMKSNNYKS